MYLKVKFHQVEVFSCYASAEFLRILSVSQVLVVGVNDNFMW